MKATPVPRQLNTHYIVYYALFLDTVPARSHNISLIVTSDQIVGQSLTLECSVTTVRGITSRVDIVWSSNGLHINTMNGVTISISRRNIAIYSATYTIPQLSTTDDGRKYQCEVVINTSPPIMATGSVTLDVTGLFVIICKIDAK